MGREKITTLEKKKYLNCPKSRNSIGVVHSFSFQFIRMKEKYFNLSFYRVYLSIEITLLFLALVSLFCIFGRRNKQ